MLQEQKDLYRIPQHLDFDKIKQDRKLIDQKNWVNALVEVPVDADKPLPAMRAGQRGGI